MKLETLKPNILRIAYHQEKGDPHYGSCLWAYFDFDLDRYMLNIQSDCGDAAYRWVETPNSESFMHLMARINDDYLIHKLFRQEKFDANATLDDVRAWLGIGDEEDFQLNLTDDEREEREDALADLDGQLSGIDSADSAAYILDRWNEDNNLGLDCVWERVQTDFSAGQKRIVQIFADYVQPRILEMVKEGKP